MIGHTIYRLGAICAVLWFLIFGGYALTAPDLSVTITDFGLIMLPGVLLFFAGRACLFLLNGE